MNNRKCSDNPKRFEFGAWSAICAMALQSIVSVGCAETSATDAQENDLREAEQAFNATITYPDKSCSDAERAILDQAAPLAVQYLNSDALIKCFRSHGLSATDGDSPELALLKMKENLPTRAVCENLDGALAATGETYKISFDHGFLLNGATVEKVAAVIIHESAHFYGYGHGDPAYPSWTSGGISEPDFSMPGQIGHCAESYTAGSYIASGVDGAVVDSQGYSVFELKNGSTLAQAGRVADSFNRDQCDSGRFATGLKVRSASWIDALALECRNADGDGIRTTTPLRGGTGGTVAEDMCATGELMIGVNGSSSNYVRTLQAVCASASNLAAGTADAGRKLTMRGSADGPSFKRICPAGQAVKGIRINSGTYVDSLTLECQKVTTTAVPASATLGFLGSTQSSAASYESCPYGSVLTQINGRSASELNRLVGQCRQVKDWGDYVTLTGSEDIVVAGHGGWGGDAFIDSCPNGEALIGLEIRSAGRIDRVRGICASAEAWSTSYAAVTRTYLSAHGGTGGESPRVLECPREHFLTGWNVWYGNYGTDFVSVHGIQPICTRAED